MVSVHVSLKLQPRPQGLLLDDFQNGGSFGESRGKGWTNSPADWPIYTNKLIGLNNSKKINMANVSVSSLLLVPRP